MTVEFDVFLDSAITLGGTVSSCRSIGAFHLAPCGVRWNRQLEHVLERCRLSGRTRQVLGGQFAAIDKFPALRQREQTRAVTATRAGTSGHWCQ